MIYLSILLSIINPTFDLVKVEGGWFLMGSNEYFEDEQPVHMVYVSAFYVTKTEITNKDYLKYAQETGYPLPPYVPNIPEYFSNYPNYPVVNVNWYDAYNFCKHYGMRLPTEAEWEYMAKANDKNYTFPWGYTFNPYASNNKYLTQPDLTSLRVYFTLTGGPMPVGHFSPNPMGIYDLGGNVAEWVYDWYSPTYYNYSPNYNPKGPSSGMYKVIRGGSWIEDIQYLRSSYRGYAVPYEYFINVGFRCVKSVY